MKQLTIIGNLGKDIETLSTGNYNVTVGVSDDVDKSQTDWFNCYLEKQAFGKIIPYLKKGSHVLFMGRMYITTTKDGKTKMNLQVKDCKIMNSKPTTTQVNIGEIAATGKLATAFNQAQNHPLDATVHNDDLPF